MTDTYLKTYLSEEISTLKSIPELVKQFTDLWWESETCPPDLGRKYGRWEQIDREAHFERYLRSLNSIFEKMPPASPGRTAAHEGILSATLDFARLALDFDDHQIASIRAYGFAEVAAEFARNARRFDPELSDQAIFQASRNVWSMNFMQLMIGLSVELTPAIFAYSLLYPYSDNYLDDPKIPSETKRAFSQRFARRLAGERISPANFQEQIIADLIEIIEGQFERQLYPEVYESLSAIHIAQSKSVQLLRRDSSPYEVDVLGICFEKGGASVLADGYLLSGTLTEVQREFMFYYGTLTQLVDDLEDVQQDMASGLMTVFSQTARHWPLDLVTNRTFHFSQKMLAAMDRLDASGTGPLKEIIRRSITPLLVIEVGSLGKHYTRRYLRELERHSPFGFPFLRKQRKKLSRQKVSLVSLVEALATR
jgi:hypothetical protein